MPWLRGGVSGAAFEQAREPWFNVSAGDGFYHHHRSWADDLTVPFTALAPVRGTGAIRFAGRASHRGVASGTGPGTGRDSAAASFAGLQDTYLAVRGAAEVLDAVRRCWASLYHNESVAYRRRLGLPEDGLAMAVVIQRMLRPRAAGVMFTRSPVTGDRSVVAIEGTWGLGSALVAGEVTPDPFTVSKVTGEITGRRTGAKLSLHYFRPNEPGITASAMPVALRGRPCLTDDDHILAWLEKPL
jgi:hypothetical protein